MRTAVRFFSVLAAILLLLTAALSLPADPPAISKVEPPNWWAGFQPSVMLLLYGENLADAHVSVNYSGVSVTKVQAQPDGKHVFVWLRLDTKTRPGDLGIKVKTAYGAAAATSAAAGARIAKRKVPGNHARRCRLPHHA